MNDPGATVRVLYSVPEAMALLNLSRTQIYELIRTSRLATVTQGRRRLVPADVVFSTATGSPLDPANVRRAFRRVVAAAGMDPKSWTPRELRHSFVSLLSSSGMPIEDIAHLVGHANTRVTELVYHKELRPVLTRGAVAMDALFPDDDRSRALVSRLVSRRQAHQPEGLEHDDESPPDQGLE